MSQHFAERVRQRLPGVDPDQLATCLWWAIDAGRTDLVQYLGRQDKYGKRLFRVTLSGRPHTVVAHTTRRILLTVFPEDQSAGGEGCTTGT